MSRSKEERIWKGWLEAILGFFYPEICQLCGRHRATAADGYVCGHCWSQPGGIRFLIPPFCRRCGLPFEGAISGPFQCSNCRELELPFESARAAVAATPLILDVIHRYKYRRALWFEPFLADLLERRAQEELKAAEWDALIPVPLHPSKLREREFNQAERLAARLSRAVRIPLMPDCVERVKATPTQTQLTRDERRANMQKAFRMKPGQRFSGERLVLVDDVMTTGATTAACAEVLLENGADKVCVWTVARGLWT